jgi:DNA-binding NarL/FixJ family response regulator
MAIRVLLVDDHRLVRECLRLVLTPEEGIEVVGEADGGRAAIELTEQLRPDVVVMDIGMPDINGIEATRRIVYDFPGTRVLALTARTDQGHATDMLRAGATGYVVKDAGLREVIGAIRLVASGRTHLSHTITEVIVSDYVHKFKDPDDIESSSSASSALTAREREVLQHCAQGWSTKEIASALGLSAKTVESHRRHIMEKLGIFSLGGLIRFAIREGITTLDDAVTR